MHISYSTWKWLLIGCGLALLLMMLNYPFGYDQAAFMVGGEMAVKHTAIPYRDFIDTKPPVIFFIYGISSVIFGHHEWSIRAFDILFHIVSLFYFFKLLKRATGDEKLAIVSVFLYSLFYVTSGYWMTAQAETFALLPSLLVFDLTDRIFRQKKNHFLYGIYAGLACAVLFLLKFTLLTIPLGVVVYLLLASKGEKPFQWKYLIGLVTSLIGLLAIYAIYLTATGTMGRFLESVAWVKHYADVDPLFASHTVIERYFKQFPMLAIYPFGLSGILIGAIGVLRYFKDHLQPVPSEEKKKDSSLLHLFVQLLLALLAVLFERKFFPYHFSRAYWAFVPFAALGLREMRNLWKDYILSHSRLKGGEKVLRYVIGSLIVGVLFFFSTAPRIVSQPVHFTYLQLAGSDIAQDVQDQMPQYWYKEEQQLADHLRPLMKADDKMFVWGNSIGIYYFSEKYPTTICLTNTPFISPWTPLSWKKTIIDQLLSNPPKFIVAESGDEREYISGSKKDSWQHLQEWEELRNFVEKNYEMKEGLGHFKIFQRK